MLYVGTAVMVTHCANVTLHLTVLIVYRGEIALERRGEGNPHTVALTDCYRQDKAQLPWYQNGGIT